MCTTKTYTITSATRTGAHTGTLQQAVAAAVRIERDLPFSDPEVTISLGADFLGRVDAIGPCERLRANCRAEALEEEAEHEPIKVFADHLRDCARALRAEAKKR